MTPDGRQTPQHLLEQVQIQKQRAIATLDLAARNAIESARELRHAKDTIALLESGIKLPTDLMSVSPPDIDSSRQDDSQTIVRLQGEIASLHAEIDALKSSHAAMLDALRSQLHAANYACAAAESQLKRLQVGFLQTERSIQSSLAEFSRAVRVPARQAPIATPPPPIMAGGEQARLLPSNNGAVGPVASADDIPPDSLTAISDGERRQAAKRSRKTPQFDLQTLVDAFAPGSSTAVALRLIRAGFDEKALSEDQLVQMAVDSIGRTTSSSMEQHGRFLSELFGRDNMKSLIDKFLIQLWRRIVMATETRSVPIRAAVHALAQLCFKASRIQHLRVFVFDLLRMRPCFEIELFAIVFRIVPNVLDSSYRSALRDAICAVVCDALHCLADNHAAKRDILLNPFWTVALRHHDPAQFSSGVESAIRQIVSGSADDIVDGIRALELIALSRGWSWSCTYVIGPVWQRIRSASDLQVVVHLISAVAVVGRTSSSDSSNANGAAFLQRIVSGLHSFLDTAFPIEIQVAAADAVVVLANGSVSNLRDLYKWFVTAPDAVRSLLPSALRDDITFIGKQVSVR